MKTTISVSASLFQSTKWKCAVMRPSVRSGCFIAKAGFRAIRFISQPKADQSPASSAEAKVNEAELLAVLGITTNELAPLPIQNACTSRVKTLVPLKSAAVLDELKPD